MEKEIKENCYTVTELDVHAKLNRILGPKYAKYRENWKKALPSSIPKFPVHVDFELVDSCNQSCDFCPRNEKTHPNIEYDINSGDKLDTEIVDKIVKESGENSLDSVNFAFGEPLLYKNIFKVVKKFHDAGVVDSRVITNGLLLHKYTDEIFTSNLVNLFVSLDAFSEETYKEVRGVGYKKVVNNILNVIEEREKRNRELPLVRVSFVETEINRHEKEAFIEFWKDKVDFIDIQTFIDFNKTSFDITKSKKWTCMDPFRRVSILANGDIIPCCTFSGKLLSVANIKDSTIAEAWKNDKMQLVRKNLLDDKEKICLICQGS